MRFIKIINQKKILLFSILVFFCIYIMLNLLDGERGLISYYDKQKIKKQLIHEKSALIEELAIIENKNNLLTKVIDLDYLEILYREKFTVGKTNEKIYKID